MKTRRYTITIEYNDNAVHPINIVVMESGTIAFEIRGKSVRKLLNNAADRIAVLEKVE